VRQPEGSMSRSNSQLVSTPRILAASLAGTAIEFYDFFIYGTAASLVFGKLFFAAAPPTTQLLAAYASFSVAFVARPIGALAFGHFGDRVGRKSTLIASLLLMGISTMAIGLLPTYAQVGWPAPVLLCLLRFGQGLGLGGEWGGAALLAMENAPASSRGRYGMFPQLGAPVGFLAANGFFLLLGLVLSPAQFSAWGWRIPFLASAVLVGLGLWVRMRLTETPVFAAALAEAPPPRVPAGTLLRENLPHHHLHAGLRNHDLGLRPARVSGRFTGRHAVSRRRDTVLRSLVRPAQSAPGVDCRLRRRGALGTPLGTGARERLDGGYLVVSLSGAVCDGTRVRTFGRVDAESVSSSGALYRCVAGIHRGWNLRRWHRTDRCAVAGDSRRSHLGGFVLERGGTVESPCSRDVGTLREALSKYIFLIG
jgi:MFS family permease